MTTKVESTSYQPSGIGLDDNAPSRTSLDDQTVEQNKDLEHLDKNFLSSLINGTSLLQTSGAIKTGVSNCNTIQPEKLLEKLLSFRHLLSWAQFGQSDSMVSLKLRAEDIVKDIINLFGGSQKIKMLQLLNKKYNPEEVEEMLGPINEITGKMFAVITKRINGSQQNIIVDIRELTDSELKEINSCALPKNHDALVNNAIIPKDISQYELKNCLAERGSINPEKLMRVIIDLIDVPLRSLRVVEYGPRKMLQIIKLFVGLGLELVLWREIIPEFAWQTIKELGYSSPETASKIRYVPPNQDLSAHLGLWISPYDRTLFGGFKVLGADIVPRGLLIVETDEMNPKEISELPDADNWTLLYYIELSRGKTFFASAPPFIKQNRPRYLQIWKRLPTSDQLAKKVIINETLINTVGVSSLLGGISTPIFTVEVENSLKQLGPENNLTNLTERLNKEVEKIGNISGKLTRKIEKSP